MRKLLTAAFLVGSCTLYQAHAQKPTLPYKKPQKVTIGKQAATGLPPSTVTEFCLNYPRYFFDLPSYYKQVAFNRFRTAGLTLTPEVHLAKELAQSSALREVAYHSLYDFCASLQKEYLKPADELLFIVLYEKLHMNTGPATILAIYCKQHYQRLLTPSSIPSSRQSTENAIDTSSAKVPLMERETSNTLATAPTPSSSHTGGGSGLEMSGWRLKSPPIVEAVDDNSGVVRFKIKVTDDGQVASVTKISGNVSPAQEKLCRDKLLDANFIRTDLVQGGATGFYTFRFTVR